MEGVNFMEGLNFRYFISHNACHKFGGQFGDGAVSEHYIVLFSGSHVATSGNEFINKAHTLTYQSFNLPHN